MAEKVELQILSNAKMILGELRLVNAELHNIRDNTNRMNAATSKATSGMSAQGKHLAGLALRFVGYNFVLNQVMGAQQKFIEFIKESVSAYREFETRLAEISTILGSDQLPLMDRLKIGIENLSMAYGQATSDMSKGMYDILSAAFDAEDALNLLTTATQASIAGLSDIRTSVDIFTTVLNTYGMQVEQATNVSNILFQSVVRGKFQFEELESALGYVVPIAAQAGIQFEELMAALSTTTRHGLHLDMASRGLSMAIQGIINPSVAATKAAEKYGIEMNGLALRVMGLQGWFEQLNSATKEYGQSIMGELIPNIRSLRVAMVLASDVGLEGFNDDLLELANMGNATETALERIVETSQFVSNQLTQQWEQTKRKIGEDFDDLVMNIQRGILAIGKFFTGGNIGYQSTAGEGYTFIKDDAIHNATEYLKITEKIKELEDERAQVASADIEKKEGFSLFPGLSEAGEKYQKSQLKKLGLSKTVKEIDADMATLLEKQEEYLPDFNEVVGGILNEIDALGDLELTLNNVELAIKALEDELLKTFVYGFKDANGVMKEASVNIEDLTTLTDEQRAALMGLGNTIQGNLAYQYMALHAQREYADATHDVSIGLKMAGYVYKEIPADIQAAIDAVREYTKAQDENREATARMTAEMRKYQIQLLEIQLKGMLRRRGLTREEERQIKRIQIAQAKARLEDMKSQKEVESSDVSAYQKSQQLIDNYLLKVQEKQYELKYTYDQQIADLETMISQEGTKLQTRYDWYETTNQKILEGAQTFVTTLNEILEQDVFVEKLETYGLKVDELKLKMESLVDVAAGREGTYIPEKELESTEITEAPKLPTLYERLPPAIQNIFKNLGIQMPGSQSSSKTEIGNVNINVKSVSDIDSIEKIAAIIGQGYSSGLYTKGKSNFRFRIG